MKPIRDPAVAAAFSAYPSGIRRKLMALRSPILNTAAATPGVGEVEETLKWGEPAYLTSMTRSGSTIRIGWKKAAPAKYAMYFNCRTTLVDTFRTLYPDTFRYEGNRAIIFQEDDVLQAEELARCITAALTYHRDGKKR